MPVIKLVTLAALCRLGVSILLYSIDIDVLMMYWLVANVHVPWLNGSTNWDAEVILRHC